MQVINIFCNFCRLNNCLNAPGMRTNLSSTLQVLNTIACGWAARTQDRVDFLN